MTPAFRPRFRRRSADATDESRPAPGAADRPGADTAPGDAAPGDAAPGDAAPGVGDDTAPGDAAPGDAAPGVGDDGNDGDDEWLAYELHGWALESRVMLQQLLTADRVVHSWQGTTLLVHESLEEAVDLLVDEVQETEDATRPIGPDEELTAFEIGDWSQEMRSELVERLVQARVPHVVDEAAPVHGADDGGDGDGGEGAGGAGDGGGEGAGGDGGGEGDDGDGEGEGADDGGEGEGADDGGEGDDGDGDDGAGEGEGGAGEGEGGAGGGDGDQFGCDLLVREADEERVELVIDDILARVEEAHLEELDGLEVNNLLSDVFLACDRLGRDPRDLEGVRGVMTQAPRVAGVRTPFGFSPPAWRNLRQAVAELLAEVQSDDTDEDGLRDLASGLSDMLRRLI